MAHYLLESCIALSNLEKARYKKIDESAAKAEKEKKDKYEEIQDLREQAEIRRNINYNYRKNVLTEMLSTTMKAVYISALESCMSLTKENEALANSLVDNYIKENGVRNILDSKFSNKTYLLSRMKSIVEDTAEEINSNADDDDKETGTVPEDNKEKMFDKLEKEDDVDAAVDIISTRISNAEEEFIKKNAEDKEKIEGIITDINDRIKSVKDDNSIPEESKEKIEQEAALDCKRKIAEITNKRGHGIFETMVEKVSRSVMKDPELKPLYTTESGALDMDKIVSSVKCMYGFLEFVATTKIENVDQNYVHEVLEEI